MIPNSIQFPPLTLYPRSLTRNPFLSLSQLQRNLILSQGWPQLPALARSLTQFLLLLSITEIEAAQVFAKATGQASQNPPHTSAKWEQTANLWQKAIARLEEISVEDSGYASAQKLLATYQTNLWTVQTHLQAEQEALETLKQVQTSSQDLVANASSSDSNQTTAKLQGMVSQLQTVSPGTTAYAEAQNLLQSAQEKLKQL